MPYESMHHHQSAAAAVAAGIAPNSMLDALSVQLRDAEMRRTEIERAHQVSHAHARESVRENQLILTQQQETLAQIRNLSGSARPDTEAVENLQSRARELEKKVRSARPKCPTH